MVLGVVIKVCVCVCVLLFLLFVRDIVLVCMTSVCCSLCGLVYVIVCVVWCAALFVKLSWSASV